MVNSNRYSQHISKLGKRKRNQLQASVSLVYLEFMKKRKRSDDLKHYSKFNGHDFLKVLRILQNNVRLLLHQRERSLCYLVVVISLVLCFMFNLIILYDDLHQTEDPLLSRTAELVKSEDFKAPNDLLKMTAMGVKTYNRPECLQELIKSVRTFAPYLPIIVADDSDQDVQSYLQTGDQGDVNIRLPTDSGVGYGRNRIVQAIHAAGYKYLIMADDDFKLTSGETIPMLAKYLHETGADVVAATRCDHNMDNCQRSKGLLVVRNNTLTVVPNVTSYPSYPAAPSCYRSDLVQQFFMGRTERLMDIHWDDKLKNNDHYDFLLNAKANNLKLVTCSDVLIFHEKSCENRSVYGEAYTTKRERRWYELLKYLMRKWNLTTIHDEVGKTLILNANGTGRGSLPKTHKYSIKAAETRSYSASVVHAMNTGVAAWTWLRPIFDKLTWVIKRTVNPCSFLVSGSLHLEYDRYKTFKNAQSYQRYQIYMYEEKCSFAESLWRLKSHGIVDTHAHVYYVTAVANDNSYLKRLLHILDNDINKDNMTLIIVLMDAISLRVILANLRTIKFEVIIVDQGPPFSRSIGLKAGFNRAIKLAYERNQPNAIGFSIDTSIIPPNNFTAQIQHNTICGVTAFVPIVFKCMSCLKGDLTNRSDGYWVYTGFGMVGLCLSDYVAVGGWSTVWGYRWGGEDVDIMERIGSKMPHVIRTKEPNYIYVRNPTVKDKNPAYYTKRNLYPKPLPPSSLTTPSFKAEINRRLLDFFKSNIATDTKKSLADSKVLSVKKTYTDFEKGLEYFVLLLDNQNATHWFFVHSFLSPLL